VVYRQEMDVVDASRSLQRIGDLRVLGTRTLAMASASNGAARHAYPGVGTRSGRSSTDLGAAVEVPPGQAPSDRTPV
jgi:hypothetical protein